MGLANTLAGGQPQEQKYAQPEQSNIDQSASFSEDSIDPMIKDKLDLLEKK